MGTNELAERILRHLDGAEQLLDRYLSGAYTGRWFNELGPRGDAAGAADSFTGADITAVRTLSVRVPPMDCGALVRRGSVQTMRGLHNPHRRHRRP